MRGRFITLEGIDGAGKSTHLGWIASLLDRRGIRCTVTREPGGTPLGERLRAMLLQHAEPLSPETETLLIFAARRQHVVDVILPALDAGIWILCDRFTDATFAYQGGGSGVAKPKLAQLEEWVHPGLQPDLTILFDIDPVIARSRTRVRTARDRFESEAADYHERVRNAYLERARDCPARIHIVDATMPVPEVQKFLEKVITNHCL